MPACLRWGQGDVNHNGVKEASCTVVKAFIKEGEKQQRTLTVNNAADLIATSNSQYCYCMPSAAVRLESVGFCLGTQPS